MKNNQQVTKINDFSVGTSETICVLTNKQKEWLAGIIDGNGIFDIRFMNNKRVLKSIRIIQSIRDSRILYKVKDLLKGGSIKIKNKICLIYTISTRQLIVNCINAINGNIRLKLQDFIFSCQYSGILYIEADWQIPLNSAYLAGLVDAVGSIIFNYMQNRIELLLEFKQNEYTKALNLNFVIANVKPKVYKFVKRNQNKYKVFYSIRFLYNNVNDMLSIYYYFKENRLFSDFKFFRVMLIVYFLKIRHYKNYSKDSIEFKLYNNFLIKFIAYRNQDKKLPDYIYVY